MPAHELPDLDASIRRLGRDSWYLFHSSESWRWLALPRPSEIHTNSARTSLLGLLASHADGHVREAAVKELAACLDGEELPFLIWRLADWVESVRACAEAAVRDRIGAGKLGALAQLLPLIARLQTLSRVDSGPIIDVIYSALLAEPGHKTLIGALQTGDRVLRRAACAILDRLVPAPPTMVLRIVESDTDTVVRSWLLRWENRMRSDRPDEAADLRGRLIGDPAPRLRSGGLYAAIDAKDADVMSQLERALLDPSPSIRELARYSLRTADPGRNFAALYRSAIEGGKSVPAIMGLGETGSKTDIYRVLPLLSGTSRRARAALRAAVWLDADSCRDALLTALADPRDGVCKEARLLLGRGRLPVEEAARLEQLWIAATTVKAQRAVVSAILRLPPWPALGGLLRSYRILDRDRLTAVSAGIDAWRPEHQQLYAPKPAPEALRRGLWEAFDLAQDLLGRPRKARIETALHTWASSDVFGNGR